MKMSIPNLCLSFIILTNTACTNNSTTKKLVNDEDPRSKVILAEIAEADAKVKEGVCKVKKGGKLLAEGEALINDGSKKIIKGNEEISDSKLSLMENLMEESYHGVGES